MEENLNEYGNMDEELIVFESEDGEEYSFRVANYFFYNGDEYALLEDVTGGAEGEEDPGYIVCKVSSGTDEDGEETDVFDIVEDEEMAERLFRIASTKLDEGEED